MIVGFKRSSTLAGNFASSQGGEKVGEGRSSADNPLQVHEAVGTLAKHKMKFRHVLNQGRREKRGREALVRKTMRRRSPSRPEVR